MPPAGFVVRGRTPGDDVCTTMNPRWRRRSREGDICLVLSATVRVLIEPARPARGAGNRTWHASDVTVAKPLPSQTRRPPQAQSLSGVAPAPPSISSKTADKRCKPNSRSPMSKHGRGAHAFRIEWTRRRPRMITESLPCAPHEPLFALLTSLAPLPPRGRRDRAAPATSPTSLGGLAPASGAARDLCFSSVAR